MRGEETDMNILIALALLVWLISRCGKRRAAEPKKTPPEEPGWVDELELLDAATDDFV